MICKSCGQPITTQKVFATGGQFPLCYPCADKLNEKNTMMVGGIFAVLIILSLIIMKVLSYFGVIS